MFKLRAIVVFLTSLIATSAHAQKVPLYEIQLAIELPMPTPTTTPTATPTPVVTPTATPTPPVFGPPPPLLSPLWIETLEERCKPSEFSFSLLSNEACQAGLQIDFRLTRHCTFEVVGGWHEFDFDDPFRTPDTVQFSFCWR